MVYRSARRRPVAYRRTARTSSRGRSLLVRDYISGSLTNGAAAQVFSPLGNVETRIGAEIWGTRVMSVSGTLGIGQISTTATQFGAVYFGAMVSRSESSDLAAGHPNPDYVSTNNDRYSAWYGLMHVVSPRVVSATLTGVVSQDPVQRNFKWSRSRYNMISTPEDQFLFSFAYDQGAGASTINFGLWYEIWLRLP